VLSNNGSCELRLRHRRLQRTKLREGAVSAGSAGSAALTAALRNVRQVRCCDLLCML
jgi:hypothetical protein